MDTLRERLNYTFNTIWNMDTNSDKEIDFNQGAISDLVR